MQEMYITNCMSLFAEAKSTTHDYQNIINETSEQSNGITPSSKVCT